VAERIRNHALRISVTKRLISQFFPTPFPRCFSNRRYYDVEPPQWNRAIIISRKTPSFFNDSLSTISTGREFSHRFCRLHSFMASFIQRRTLFNMNGGTPNKFIWFFRVPPRWRKTVPSKTMNVCTRLLSLAIVSVSTLWRIITH
jgi:hypothetical protein